MVPKSVEEEVFVKAIEKARAEKMVANALKNGMKATEVYLKFGIM